MALNWSLHKTILVRILHDIFTHQSIAPHLGFKGGTAAMLFYDLDRFSVDLDLDLLTIEKKEHIFNHLKEILSKLGTLKKADDKRYNLFFLLSYEGKSEGAYNVKVEVNKRSFGSKYSILQYLGVSMRVMKKNDMFAHKLVALYERKGETNRDIYDVHYFLKHHFDITKKIIQMRTQLDYPTFLKACIKTVSKVENTRILSGLGELLTPQKKVWVKNHLKEETIFLLRLALETEKT